MVSKRLYFDGPPEISSEFDTSYSIVLHEGYAREFLKTIPDNEITLIVTSPPYNIGKIYENKRSIEEYLEEQEEVINEVVRILSDDGSICWEVGNYVEKREVFPLDMFFYDMFKKRGLKLRNRIIWRFGHGLHASLRFSGRYETILWFTKSDDYKFNLDSVRIPAKYPGKRHFKGPNKGKPSGNPLGKNPSDVWEIVTSDWEKGIWEIPNVKANHPEKTQHPCQFPIELVERCVLALTDKEDWVLDPYCGVGSALIAGLIHERKGIGCDKEHEYVEVAKKRIKALFGGTLKRRPLGKPIFKPTGSERVSKLPDEWNDDGGDNKLL